MPFQKALAERDTGKLNIGLFRTEETFGRILPLLRVVWMQRVVAGVYKHGNR